MIPTATIRAALLRQLEASGLFKKVIAFSTADISEALENLRSHPDSLAVIVPSSDDWSHDLTEDDNTPLRAEVRNKFEILVSSRELSARTDGALDCVTLKDQTAAALLWAALGIPGLLCLPLSAEPMLIEFDERRGREAWKITLEIRQQIFAN